MLAKLKSTTSVFALMYAWQHQQKEPGMEPSSFAMQGAVYLRPLTFSEVTALEYACQGGHRFAVCDSETGDILCYALNTALAVSQARQMGFVPYRIH